MWLLGAATKQAIGFKHHGPTSRSAKYRGARGSPLGSGPSVSSRRAPRRATKTNLSQTDQVASI